MVVVIDAIRAFTNAAFAFSRRKGNLSGKQRGRALKFKVEVPNSLACGEVGSSSGMA
jgi:hypothetical protein